MLDFCDMKLWDYCIIPSDEEVIFFYVSNSKSVLKKI